MKLSQLVSYRELLDRLTPENVEETTKIYLGSVLHAVKSSSLQIPDRTLELESKYQSVNQAFYSFLETLEEIKKQLNQSILDQESSYLIESYKLYESMHSDSPDYILNRRFNVPDHLVDFIHGRIKKNCNWKYPGAIIRPGLESWADSMVAADPLYVIDTNYKLLDDLKKRFNKQYTQRVRWNVIEESSSRILLESIPDSQIGFFLCYNFFHYKPFEIMKKYLIEIFDKLRPGGTLAITFNDCDRYGAVVNTERCYMCYTPGRLVKSLCDSIGFEIICSQELDAAATWLELKKPGTLSSLRGGQSLAKVNPKIDH